MLLRFALVLLVVLPSTLFTPVQQQPRNPGQLKQIIPGHYVYSSIVGGRYFNSGVIVTSEGVLVFDALESEATGRSEREAISSIIKRPVRLLVSSTFHDNYSKGNLAYSDVFKLGHENYRIGFLEQLQRGGASAEEQQARLPNQTFRDRAALHLGGKDIQVLYLGSGHTRGDSIIFVPQDRIAYLSELFFAEEFPNSAQGYGASWLRVLDQIEALPADIFVAGHGAVPENPRETRAQLHRMRQIFVDARDALQEQITQGVTEDQAVAAVKLQQYEKLPTYNEQRETFVRRMYKEMKGGLP
jgi:glyoxylase-like metal-dependent hydrolase (beta-lactamase superfamily II)